MNLGPLPSEQPSSLAELTSNVMLNLSDLLYQLAAKNVMVRIPVAT